MKAAYQSDTYYDVVIRGKLYQGWCCVYAGDGTLVFQKASGEERRFSDDSRPGWLEKCWDKFTEMAEKQAAKVTA